MTEYEIIELAKKCGMETETYREVTLIKDASDHQHITKDILLAFATEIRNRTIMECGSVCKDEGIRQERIFDDFVSRPENSKASATCYAAIYFGMSDRILALKVNQ